ncbi:hypothetical protein EDD11_009256 [Mortierella claussenii]|nr:hypothetical protein EDD11_009256 [Mortierella claussenii]
MGVIIPFCVVTDNVRFYGLGAGVPLNKTDDRHYVYFKSNDYPSYDLKDLTWSLVSAIPSNQLASIRLWSWPKSYSCALDDTGVFTIIASDFMEAGFNLKSIQYQPTPPSTNTTAGGVASIAGTAGSASGSWRNITLPQNVTEYHWSDNYEQRLFNFKDQQGQNNLMHAYIYNNLNGTNFYLAALDKTTMSMKEGPVAWNITGENFGVLQGLAYGNQTIHAYVDAIDEARVYQIPITSASTTPPATIPHTYFNATDFYKACNQSPLIRTLVNDLYLFCTNTVPALISKYNGTGLTKLPAVSNGINFDDVFSLLPFPGGAPTNTTTAPATPYTFLYDKAGVYSIPLEGTFASVLLKAPQNMTIPDDFQDPQTIPTKTLPLPPPASNLPATAVTTSGLNTGTEEQHSNANKGMVGGLVACLVVAAAVLIFTLKTTKATPRGRRGGFGGFFRGWRGGVDEQAAATAGTGETGASATSVGNSQEGDPEKPLHPYLSEKPLLEIKQSVDPQNNNVLPSPSAANASTVFNPGQAYTLPKSQVPTSDDVWEWKTVVPSPSAAGASTHSSPSVPTPTIPAHSKPRMS